MPKVVLRAENLSQSFSDGSEISQILNQISLTLVEGQQVGLLGASGSGKSTLLHLLGGLDKPTLGSVILAEKHDLTKATLAQKARLRNHYLGFVYQFHHLLSEFNVIENVAMPLLIRGVGLEEAQDKSWALLKYIGLENRGRYAIAKLSGGQKQRVAIARALVTDPICVLADEPTGNLDHKTAQQVYDCMMLLQSRLSTAFLIATHSNDLVKRMDKAYFLEQGNLRVL